MPKSLEPGVRMPVVLDSDQGKTPCPTFYAKSLSIRAFREIMDGLNAIKKSTSQTTQMMIALDHVCGAIVGWDNMIDPDTKQPIEFTSEALAETIDLLECIELLGKIMQLNTPTLDDQKKLESPH